jgi:hypothetical protein
MNIPTIGGARGIFEFFVPGIFLLLNMGWAAYLFPNINDETKSVIKAIALEPALAVLVGVSFGYLLGVVLRLFQTDLPDRLSAAWLRIFNRGVRENNRNFKLWAIEHFPYFGWIEQVCKLYLPVEALDFYQRTWGLRKQGEQNKQFFTFIKTLINSEDERAADEMYAAESLSRYLAGMFYALCFACFSLLVTIIASYLMLAQVQVGLIIILVIYFFIIVEILAHYRFIRIKEVEIVFAASFRNKEYLEEALSKGKDIKRNSAKKHVSAETKSA